MSKQIKPTQKVKVERSIEGSPYQEIIINYELVHALSETQLADETWTYLMFRNLLTDDLSKKIMAIIEEQKPVFQKYELGKYELRAQYKFEQSELLNEEDSSIESISDKDLTDCEVKCDIGKCPVCGSEDIEYVDSCSLALDDDYTVDKWECSVCESEWSITNTIIYEYHNINIDGRYKSAEE